MSNHKKTLEEIGIEIKRHQQDRVPDIKGKMIRKYELTEEEYAEAEEHAFYA